MAVYRKESFRRLAACAWFCHVTVDALQTLQVMRSKVKGQGHGTKTRFIMS